MQAIERRATDPFHVALGDARYIEIARKVARYLTGAYSVFPTNFLGMAGFCNF